MMFRSSVVAFSLAMTSFVHAESLRIEPKHANFDAATAYSTVSQSYTVTNGGERSVAIRNFKSIGGPGEVKNLPESLAPGESKVFQIELPLPGQPGSSLNRFALFTDEADVERYRFTLSGTVYSLITPQDAQLDLGKIDATSTSSHELTLETREAVALKLTRIESAPDWLQAHVTGSTVAVRIRPDAGWGMQAGIIKIATNLPLQPFVQVTVKAVIEGRLIPSTYGVGLRPQQIGTTAETSIELAYTGRADLAQLKTEALPGWKVSSEKCAATPAPGAQCRKVTVRKLLDETGRFAGFLRFTLDGEPPLSVPFGAMVLGKDQTVRELVLNDNSELANPGYANFQQSLTEALTSKPTDTPSPVASRAPARDLEKIAHSEGKAPVTLNWSSANDAKIEGYMVYRSEDRAGPFQRVSEKPVPRDASSAASSDLAKYRFVDSAVSAGKTYYYYIDTIGSDGSQQRFSPVLSKKVVP